LQAERLGGELVERGGRARDEVASVVEHPHVGEPRQGVQPTPHAIRRDHAFEEAVGVGAEAVEREDPPGRGELRRPHHVELEDVGLARPRVEPLDVALVPLVGGVRRRAHEHRRRRRA
jgi:hypothetical protein